MGAKRRFDINQGWHFRQHDDPEAGYLPTQGFPTEIHRDLLKHGIIPDPFRGKHEEGVQWVAEIPWIYRTAFSTPQTVGGERVILAFDGLDTYAQVVLNGRTILQTENMFLPERVDVTDLVSLLDEDNILEIVFESALLKGKKFVEEQPNHRWGCWNGDPSRLAVRKAQYHYGWDWGPQLMTCGPWRPIHLEVYHSQIVDLAFDVEVSDSLDTAAICASVNVDGEASRVKFEMSMNDALVARETVEINNEKAQATFRTSKPKLWYPRRYGQQPLYLLTATLLDDEAVLDVVSKRLGIRKAKAVQHKLKNSPGSSFMFEINNVPIFCGGSNWIPADSLLTRLTPSRYRDWVRMASNGNQRMLRVWGGGIYEDDAFYDACDEMGVLVWQDFMFACGNYPVHSDFLRTVEYEAVANVRRLRHHPSIVIFAGNNEDYQYAESEGLYYDPTDKCPESWLRSTFPARYIYEKLLKDVMSVLLPDTYYHFGSPYSETETTDPCRGDLHQWNVWHGSQEQYQDFDALSGRFVSEFGMQALPNWETVQEFFDPEDDDAEKYAQSSTVSFHNKAAGHDRRLGIYLTENIRYDFEPFEYYVYCTQVMQADCVTSAFSAWKRNWKGPGNEQCAGTLVWQTNDCWPSTSWAISDYSLRPKLAYYAVKRQMEQVTLGMKRTINRVPADKYTHAHVKTVYKIELWACNFDLQAHDLPITISTIHLDTGIHRHHGQLSRSHVLGPNRTTELMGFEIPVLHQDAGEESQTIVCATLEGPTHSTKKDFIDWPQPLKYLHLNQYSGRKEPHISLALSLPWESLDEVKSGLCPQNPRLQGVRWLNIKTDFPLKAVNVECKNASTDNANTATLDDDWPLKAVNGGEGKEAFDNAGAAALEDNGFDVMPGRWIQVRVNGLDRSLAAQFEFRITHLGSGGRAEYQRVGLVKSMVLLLKIPGG